MRSSQKYNWSQNNFTSMNLYVVFASPIVDLGTKIGICE